MRDEHGITSKTSFDSITVTKKSVTLRSVVASKMTHNNNYAHSFAIAVGDSRLVSSKINICFIYIDTHTPKAATAVLCYDETKSTS